jgi:hypothetical protein
VDLSVYYIEMRGENKVKTNQTVQNSILGLYTFFGKESAGGSRKGPTVTTLPLTTSHGKDISKWL